MTNSLDRRDAAIKALRDREVQATQRVAEQNRQRHEQYQRQQERLNAWGVTTSAIIANAVTSVSNDLVRRGSQLLFSPVTSTKRDVIGFELRRSGSITPLVYIHFAMNNNGEVSVTSNARGVDLPPSIPLSDVTHNWVEGITEEVFIAVAENRGMLVPD